MNKQNKIIVGVVALVLALTIGYAIFSQSLNINGTAKAEGNLDIVFNEVGEISPHGTNTPTATITENGRKLELSEITLDYPTAYVDIPVTIVNNGTVDGVLEGITVENLETDDIKVTINDIAENQVIKMYNANDETTKVKATIRVEWLDKTDTKTESVKDISITLNAKQLVKEVVTTKDSSTSKCTEFTKKDTYSVGDMISFCNTDTGKSEDFYVIKDNGDNVTALARYNLMVGNKIIMEGDGSIETITLDTEHYGLQSKDTVFDLTEEGLPATAIAYGATAFANSDENNKNSNSHNLGYWTNAENSVLNKPLSKYGESYTANVYDENSLLWAPVQNYKSYFVNTLKKSSADMRLITYDELIGLGCSADTRKCTKDFVYKNSNYWTGSANGPWNVLSVIDNRFSDTDYWLSFVLGVRPVITISKSEI